MNKNGYSYPKNSTGNVIWEIIWPLAVYFLSSVVLGVILGIVLVVVVGKTGAEKLVNDNYVLLNILSQIVALAVLLPVYLNRKKYTPSKKLVIQKEPKKAIIYILIVISVGIISGFACDLIEKLVKMPDGGIDSVNKIFNSNGLLLAILTAVVLAPLVEEVLFRGLVLNRLNSKMSVIMAIIISALIFGIYHMNIIQGVNAFVLGLALGYIYVKTYNLWICILAHFGNNLISIIQQRISYSINHTYTSNTTISIILQIIIVIITIILVIKNRKMLELNKVSEKTN